MDSSPQKKPLWTGSSNRYTSSDTRPTRNRQPSLPWFALTCNREVIGYRLQ
jgi:hypothetical protein